MSSFKQTCIELRKQGHTLGEIMEITNRNKSSVYYHIKDIPLSQTKQEKIKQAATDRITAYTYSQKGISKRGFSTFQNWDKGYVKLVSHLIFDGSVTKRSCVYQNRSEALIKRVSKNMARIYDYPPKILSMSSGVTRISYHNVELASYLQQKSTELCADMSDEKLDLQIVFLQAFFDDEGSVGYNSEINQRRVRGYQKDISILELVQTLLANLGIKSTIRTGTCGEVVISRKEDLEKFQTHINFSPGVHVNGDRSNSRWGE